MKYFEGDDHYEVRGGVHDEAKVVQDQIDRDLLGVKRPAWNASVGTVGHPNEKQMRHGLMDIKTGVDDEKPQHCKDKQTYAGTDTRNMYHDGWEVSNQTVHPRDAARTLQAT